MLMLAIIFAFTACKKDPKDVVLTADKTTVTKGTVVDFTCTDDGTAEWFNYHIKNPNESAFSDGESGGVGGGFNLNFSTIFQAIA